MKKILIVEDDMIISLVVENMVKELGYQVVGKTDSGEEAIELSLSLNPDIILMDIRLKGEMDGIEAVKKINEQAHISVIYLTGNSDRQSYERVQRTSFTDMIVKPFTLHELSKSLKLVV